MSLPIHLEETESKGRFFTDEQSGETAEMTFSKTGTTLMIIDHTGVPDAFRGQGVGLKLVEAGVEYARKHNRKITPLCPFAAAQFARHPEWGDVLNR